MKKRVAALALAWALLSAPALGEERYSTVEVNGMPEILAETRYQNIGVGFSCWYAPGFFSLLWDTLSDPQGQLMLHGSPENGDPVFLTAENPKKTGLSGDAFLTEAPLRDGLSKDSLTEIESYRSPQGDTFRYRAGYDGGFCYEYYSVKKTINKKSRELLLRTCCPVLDPEGYGVRLSHAVFSFDLE